MSKNLHFRPNNRLSFTALASGYFVAILFTVYFIIAFVAIANNDTVFLIQSTVIVVLLGIIPTCVVIRAVRADEKAVSTVHKNHVEQTLSGIFTDITYRPEFALPRTVPESTGMIEFGRVYRSSDYLKAKYKGIDFIQADIYAATSTTEDAKILFDGRWITFYFPKRFAYKLKIVDKGFANPQKLPDPDASTGRKFCKITTESPTFNAKFDVYTEDEFEAYYILDPALIDRIERYKARYKGAMLLIFTENTLSIAINGYNSFEPTFEHLVLNQGFNEKAAAAKISEDAKLITDFIDYLRIDQKFYKQRGA